MASSVTAITAAKALANCTAYLLSGTIKLVAEDMVAADVVLIYEETGTEGNYQLVKESPKRAARLDFDMPSIILEGYGNYKFLLGADTDAGLVVGYVSS